MTPDLISLIERVERGVGPDRELDGAIHVALFPDSVASRFITGAYRTEWWKFGTPQGLVYRTENGGGGVPLPSYTASLDAVIALIEVKLPGWDFAFRRQMSCMGAVWLHQKHEGYHASSPARALLAATLRAIQESRK